MGRVSSIKKIIIKGEIRFKQTSFLSFITKCNINEMIMVNILTKVIVKKKY